MSPLGEFCRDFGVAEEALGPLLRVKGRCYLRPAGLEAEGLPVEGAGIYLGDERRAFAPSPALLELLAAKSAAHRAVVDEKAAWLFLCGRDIFAKGIVERGRPTEKGLLLVMNGRGENLGYGAAVKKGNVAIKNLLDRGFYLRRER